MGRGSRLPAERLAAWARFASGTSSRRRQRSIATIQGHKDAILSVAFSPDGSTIATGSYDKLVKLWDAATGKELRTLKEHSDAVYSVAFLPGGTQLVSGAGDRTLKIWDVQQRHAPLHHLRRARCRLRSGRSPVRLETRGGWRRSHDPHVDVEWRCRLGRRSGRHAADVGVRRTAMPSSASPTPPTGRRSSRPAPIARSRSGTRQRWERNGCSSRSRTGCSALALSGDGRWLAAGRYDGTLGLYSLANGGAGEQFVVPKEMSRGAGLGSGLGGSGDPTGRERTTALSRGERAKQRAQRLGVGPQAH